MKFFRGMFALVFLVALCVPYSAHAINVAGALSVPFGAKSTLMLPCTCPSQLGRVYIGRFTGPSSGVYVVSLTAVVQKPYKNRMWIMPAVWHLGKASYALPTDCMEYVGEACIPHYLLADPTGLSFPKKIKFSGTSFPGLK